MNRAQGSCRHNPATSLSLRERRGEAMRRFMGHPIPAKPSCSLQALENDVPWCNMLTFARGRGAVVHEVELSGWRVPLMCPREAAMEACAFFGMCSCNLLAQHRTDAMNTHKLKDRYTSLDNSWVAQQASKELRLVMDCLLINHRPWPIQHSFFPNCAAEEHAW